ncbi:MAG TPA: hypothetical protein VEX15_19005 [Nocardioidaceae bacterium]|nr:hypothetical protein [Nocardioidaceae bacterium]
MRRKLTVLLTAALGVSLTGFASGQTASATATAEPTQQTTASKADAAGDARSPVVASPKSTPRDRRATTKYWTAERMRNAIPADKLSVQAAKLARTSAPLPADELIPEVSKPAQAPVTARPGAALAGSDDTARRATTGERWTHPRTLVARTSGKVFYRTGGKNWVCSASTIAGKRNDVIITAGHCVFSDHTHKWVKHLQFVPGYTYRNGRPVAPYGIYTEKQMWTTKKYKNHENFRYDVGMIRLHRRPGGSRHVGAVVGQQGYLFGGDGTPWADSFGYPATPPRYHGKYLIHCAGDTRSAGSFGYLQRCRMNGGSSGGPWIRHMRHGAGRIFSVVSFVDIDKHTRPKIRGPYFGNTIYSMYKTVEGMRS